MAYANVQNSGLLVTTSGSGLSWTPSTAPTLNNLLTARIWRGGTAALGSTDVKDSSGTPKVYNQDVSVTNATNSRVAIYSLVVPSGLTTPLKDTSTAGTLQGIFDEWSGNATTSVLDTTGSNSSTTTNTTSGTSGTINTGSNAGLVLSVLSMSGIGASSGISTTGTSFAADAVEQDNNTNDSGSADSRTASVASQTGLQDSWSWTAGASNNQYSACIASYNLASSGGTPSSSDSATLTDTANTVKITGPADSATLTDASKIGVNPTDSAAVTDTANKIGVSASDSASVSDSATVQAPKAATDSVTESDSASVNTGSIPVSGTDSATLTDTAAINVGTSDSATVHEAASTPGPLRAIARDFLVGYALTGSGGANSADDLSQLPDLTLYESVAGREFNAASPENSFKMGDGVHPTQTTYDFTQADAAMAFVQSQGQAMTAGPLCWGSQLPSWLTGGSWTSSTLTAVMYDWIDTMVGHYAGQIYSWLVVNEPINTASIWNSVIGSTYIDLAFRRARAADPSAVLIINEWGCEEVNSTSDAYYSLVSGLVAGGTPIDGVGFQFHITSGGLNWASVATNFARFAALGLKIYITELDVRLVTPASPTDLATQATVYGNVFATALAQPACKGVTLWGFTDNHSWIPGAFPGDGQGLIFDVDYNSKPAYVAIANQLMIAPHTSDAASLAEQVAIKVASTDSAALTEQIKLALSATDSTQLAESMSLALARQDTATLQELVSVAIAIADAASLSEGQSVTASGGPAPGVDSAHVSDSASSTAAVSTSDIGSLAEQAAVVVAKSTSDVASLTEQIGLALVSSDSATLQEVQLAVKLAVADSAHVSELQNLIAAVLAAADAVSLGESATVRVFSGGARDWVYVIFAPSLKWTAQSPTTNWSVGAPTQ